MAWTYGADPENSQLDAVRLLIGDTDPSYPQLQDGEINWNISRGVDIYFAAASCCRQIAAKYARQINSSIESVRADAADLHKHYLALAVQMTVEGSNSGGNLGCFVSGVSISEMDAVDADTDRLKPAFISGDFDNPPGRQ